MEHFREQCKTKKKRKWQSEDKDLDDKDSKRKRERRDKTKRDIEEIDYVFHIDDDEMINCNRRSTQKC